MGGRYESSRKRFTIDMRDLSVFTTSDGCRIAYRFDGSSDRPVLVLSNAIGTTLHMWDPQIQELSEHFRVLLFDTRGHGGSDIPPGAYSFDRLGRDVSELLDTLKINRVHFCGLSLGGIIGQWLAVHTPGRIDRLILCNTSSYVGPADQWNDRIASVLKADPADTAEMFLHNWFPPALLEADGSMVAKIRAMLLATNPQGFAGCSAAIRDMDMRTTIALIACPTLVIAGQYDAVTLPSHSELIAATFPGAKLVVLPVVHLSNLVRIARHFHEGGPGISTLTVSVTPTA
jgi:3-oxoadipate enol-lactonase